MARYKVVPDIASYWVVDTERAAIAPEVHSSQLEFKPVGKCTDEGDAIMIADALNKADA